MHIFLQKLIKMSREMKIDNSFSERRIYRARSKAAMDRDIVKK